MRHAIQPVGDDLPRRSRDDSGNSVGSLDGHPVVSVRHVTVVVSVSVVGGRGVVVGGRSDDGHARGVDGAVVRPLAVVLAVVVAVVFAVVLAVVVVVLLLVVGVASVGGTFGADGTVGRDDAAGALEDDVVVVVGLGGGESHKGGDEYDLVEQQLLLVTSKIVVGYSYCLIFALASLYLWILF